MGKQNKTNPFLDFVPIQENPVKPTGFSEFVQEPLSKEQARGLFERTGAFQGDSDYDQGLTYGMDQMRNRAVNQPWYDQLGNQAAKLVPGVALGLVENAGYLGELFDNSHDYTNVFTEFAKKNRQALDEELPSYRQNPNEVFDLGDSGWWAQHGGGLVESIGEFLITGAGVGGVLGKSAKGLAKVLQANAALESGLLGSAQLGTASFLAYTEGAMSGADVYQRVLAESANPESRFYGNPEAAKQAAADAAAHTVRLNTIINTGLNLTSISPLFKTMGNLTSSAKLGLNRLRGESLQAFESRIDDLVAQGITPASLRKALLLEAGQEGGEEVVNLFAENEGLIRGGVKKPTSYSALKRFMDVAFTEEGALNALLGAVGGVGQHAGMELIPYRNYTDEQGNTIRVNNRTLHDLQQNNALVEQAATLKDNIEAIRVSQQALNDAIAKGDKNGIQQARQDLFNVALHKSITEGVGEEFTEDLKQIAQTDNAQVGEDGMTEAMRKGYADSIQDNEYKQTAHQKINDIGTLTKEYQALRQRFPNKFVADTVFRQRLQVYSLDNYKNSLATEDAKITEELLNMTRRSQVLVDGKDAATSEAVNLSANISALNQAINHLQETKAPDQIINGLKTQLMVNEHLLNEIIGDPEVKKRLSDNKGIVAQLTLSRAPLLLAGEESNYAKSIYSKLLEDPKATTKKYEDMVEAMKKDTQKKEETKQAKAEEAKQQVEKEEVKQKKAVKKAAKKTKREIVGDYTLVTKEDGTIDVIDNTADGLVVGNYANRDEALKSLKPVISAEPQKTEPEPPVDNLEPEPNVLTEEEKPEPKTEPVVVEVKPTENDITTQPDTKEEEKATEVDTEEATQSKTVGDGYAGKVVYPTRSNSDFGPIDEKGKLAHSPSVTVGTPVVLRVIEKDTIEVITKDGKLIGYIPLNKNNDPELQRVREYIIANGSVETTIVDKGPGKMNWGKNLIVVKNALPTVKQFVVVKDGKLLIGPKKEYPLKSTLKQKQYQEPHNQGKAHAIIHTPKGEEFAVPVDNAPMSRQVAHSVITAFKIFMDPITVDAHEETKALVKKVFDEFGYDLRQAKGFGAYFNFFFNNYSLANPQQVLDNYHEEQDRKEVERAKKGIKKENETRPVKHWIEFTGNSIRFLRSDGKPKEVGHNSQIKGKDGKLDPIATSKLREGLIEELERHMLGLYFNVDVKLVGTNKAISYPIFKLDEKTGLTYRTKKLANYTEHVKEVTETKLIGERIGNNEYTYFIGPEIRIDTGFVGKTAEQAYGKPLESKEKETILEPKQESQEPSPFPSKTKRFTARNMFASKAVNDELTKEANKHCK